VLYTPCGFRAKLKPPKGAYLCQGLKTEGAKQKFPKVIKTFPAMTGTKKKKELGKKKIVPPLNFAQ